MQNLVRTQNLSKRFGEQVALHAVTFEIPRGQIVGLVGPNGSGKSTLLRSLVGVHVIDGGEAFTLGVPSRDLDDGERARIGFVDQEGGLLPHLTVWKHIEYYARFYPSWDWDYTERYLELFEISPKAVSGRLSPGVRQQVAVLLATGFRPELLLLDEPASAMDPIARARFLDLLIDMIQDGRRSVVLSSHLLADVEKLADRIILFDHGRIRCDEELDALRERYRHVTVEALRGELPPALPFAGVVQAQRDGEVMELVLSDFDEREVEGIVERHGLRATYAPVPLDEIYRLELRSGHE